MKVSVVIPAYNEEVLVGACIDSLRAQDFDGELEIILVDNASTDATAAIGRAHGATVISEPERGYSRALARGFRAATGEVIASTDADTVVPVDWVSRLAREYETHPDVVAVGGEIVFCQPNGRAKVFTEWLLPILNRLDRKNPEGPHLWGANFSVRRATFLEAGGWNVDVNLQTDTELSERLRRFGRVVLLEDLPVYTSSRRWNRSLFWSLFVYATNFLSLEIFKRPLWRGFPDIREPATVVPAAAVPAPPQWRRAGAWSFAAVAVTVVGVGCYDTLSPWSTAFGNTHWSGSPNERVVALTFDDGPEEPYTTQVLDILHREHVPATFFLIGDRVERDPAAAARMIRDGDVIGNHTDSHPFALALEPADAQRTEIDTAERAIHAAAGVYPRLFRPPQGLRSPWLMRVAEQESLTTVTWDDAPGDWNPLTPNEVTSRTIARAHPGAIILLHDGLNLTWHADRSVVVKALPEIIHRLRHEGYRFVTIPELLHTASTLPTWNRLAASG